MYVATGMWANTWEVWECREIVLIRGIISSLPEVTFGLLDLYNMIEQMLFISIHRIHDGSSPELFMVGFINNCTFRIGKEWQ